MKALPPGKFNDGGGLWLHKRTDGGGQWFLRVQIHGRRREMGLGSLSEVSLKEARDSAERWRAVVREGKDPIKERQRLLREAAKVNHTLASVAEEAYEARKAELKNDGKAGRWFSPLALHVLPRLGKVPIEEIDQQDIKNTLAPIWHSKGETANKAMSRLGIVMNYAAAMGLEVDLQATAKARALLGKSRQKRKHIPAMPWQEVPAFYAIPATFRRDEFYRHRKVLEFTLPYALDDICRKRTCSASHNKNSKTVGLVGMGMKVCRYLSDNFRDEAGVYPIARSRTS
ncbi:tyrosine-type recombinase/integrase [Thalassobius vesicularis]|uniref:tyrosine-type recombinase/integrase n=1 Tax=Thalassobius vesicularis TaxID=1294297 RepID=UPI003CCC6A2F